MANKLSIVWSNSSFCMFIKSIIIVSSFDIFEVVDISSCIGYSYGVEPNGMTKNNSYS